MTVSPYDIGCNVLTLTPSQATAFYTSLIKAGLVTKISGYEMPYGFPIVVDRSLIHQSIAAVEAIQNWLVKLAKSPEQLTNWYAKRDGFEFCGVSLNVPKINQKYAELVLRGLVPPVALDRFWIDADGQATLEYIEYQTAIGYSQVQRLMRESLPQSLKLYGLAYEVGDNFAALQSLLRLTGSEPVVLFDHPEPANPQVSKTAFDKVPMAQALGFKYPADPIDVYYENNQAYVLIKDPYGKVVDRVAVKFAIARMLLSEMCKLEEAVKQDDEKRKTLIRFFTDPNVVWLHRPETQYLLDKRDFGLLNQLSVTQGMISVPIYVAGQSAQPGTYVEKPFNGESGNGQGDLILKKPQVVRNGMILHTKMKPLTVNLQTATGKKFPALFELRCHRMPSYRDSGHGATAFLMRTAPVIDLTVEPPKTNVGYAVQNRKVLAERLKITESWVPTGFHNILFKEERSC